ncbi:MAG: elongation factor G [Bauldia sp.]|uniref:elongation factor G n=1 Tax=Bauldia sp. TaxID=2575872 RepID=UPI001DC8031D|nr:elongation factor G [Bauldia sp.]MCB1494267.1 elongation factor G [Bauldia sp.]
MSDDNSGRVRGPRCIALVGPFASGKTTLLESILARTDAITRQGTIAEKNTVGDGSPEARAHQMSVEANIAETDFMGDRFTFIDCPGSVEFGFEAEPVLAGVDLAVVVAEADDKKIPALQVILKSLEDKGIPRILFLNKMDKTSASVRGTLEMLQPASAVPLVLRHIPIRQNDVVTGFIDLALERAFVYREHAASELIDMTDADRAREAEARYSMLETLADYDDGLMEQLLEDIQPDRDQIFKDLAVEMREGQICPVLIGSAEGANGIGRLLKAIRHETRGVEETRLRLGVENTGDGIVQVLKTLHTTHGGKLSIVRVLAGEIGDGTEFTGPSGPVGRVSGVFRIIGQQANKRDTASAGETVGLGKLDDALTGQTLSTAKEAPPQVVALAAPQPVLGTAVSTAERKDEVKLSSALAKAVEEDPSLRVSHVQDTGETVLEGQGEMHLRVALERLTGKYGISVDTHDPRVPYKETIRGTTTVRGRHKKQSGGHGQFGDVVLDIKPQPRGAGFAFSESISGGAVPRNYFSAIEGGIVEYLDKGPLGFPVVDVAVNLSDGSYHSVDSSDQAFRTAAQIGMREGMPQCKPVLLEPILKVEVVVPAEATPRVNGIVSQRRGQILGFDARPDWQGWDVVEAMIPQSEIRDLIVELRSATAGVGTFQASFDHLAELSGKLADQAIERASAEAA